jgi:hypothetical protein
MGVASQLTGFNMQLTIDQRATQLLNMPYFSSKDKGKNMRHVETAAVYIHMENAFVEGGIGTRGIYYGYRIHCARESVTHTNAESMWRPLPYLR